MARWTTALSGSSSPAARRWSTWPPRGRSTPEPLSPPFQNTMEQAVSPSRRTLNPLNRPRVLFALGLLVATNVATVRSQAPVDPTLVFHGVAAPRLAIPDCVPRAGDPASREAC